MTARSALAQLSSIEDRTVVLRGHAAPAIPVDWDDDGPSKTLIMEAPRTSEVHARRDRRSGVRPVAAPAPGRRGPSPFAVIRSPSCSPAPARISIAPVAFAPSRAPIPPGPRICAPRPELVSVAATPLRAGFVPKEGSGALFWSCAMVFAVFAALAYAFA